MCEKLCIPAQVEGERSKSKKTRKRKRKKRKAVIKGMYGDLKEQKRETFKGQMNAHIP